MSVVIDGSAGVTTNSGAVYNSIQSSTAVASTSGTSIDFTGIPSWVKRITVMFNGVSTNGASLVQIQLGSGSVQTTGYTSSGTFLNNSSNNTANATTGFIVQLGTSNQTRTGNLTLTLLGSNVWTGNGSFANPGQTGTVIASGQGTITGTVDRVRITTVNGTDAFNGGSVNILYE